MEADEVLVLDFFEDVHFLFEEVLVVVVLLFASQWNYFHSEESLGVISLHCFEHFRELSLSE